jgi:Protein of unknown function (DUF3616)
MTRLTYPLLLLYLLIGGSRLPASPTANITHYFEACDGSAGVALDDRFFASAEDEHNTLRIYESHPPDGQKAEPVWDKNISDFLEVDKHEEGDLEAGARIGKLIFWIGSHGTDGEGVEQPARRRLFATEIVKGADGNFALQTHGQPYKHLLDDFFVDERLKKFDLEKAASAPTKSADGLNIEALCATPEDDLLIGFRAPIPGGNALLVPLKNPKDLIDGNDGHAHFGEPILLDLGGRGFRDMAPWRGGFLIVAGPFDAAADFALYFWTGKLSDPAKKLAADLGELRPEGIIVYPGDPSRVQLLSDDGKQQPGGKKCKDMEKSERRLQSVWIDVPAL